MSKYPKLIKRAYNKVEVEIAVKGRNLHVVFVADSGPSMFINHITGADKLTYEKAAQLAQEVNVNNETGTLHPGGYAVTIVPQSVFGNRDNTGKKEVMRIHIKDVFKANEEYIQLPEIFFCIEPRPDFDYWLAKKILNELCSEPYLYTRIVSFI